MKQNGLAIEFGSAMLRADRVVALVAIRQNGEALRVVAEKLRGDLPERALGHPDQRPPHDLVIEAVRSNGLALRWASEGAKDCREVVVQAVRQAGSALEFASEGLKSDRGVVMEAVAQDLGALRWASDEIKADLDVAEEEWCRWS